MHCVVGAVPLTGSPVVGAGSVWWVGAGVMNYVMSRWWVGAGLMKYVISQCWGNEICNEAVVGRCWRLIKMGDYASLSRTEEVHHWR